MSETSTWRRTGAWDGIAPPGRLGADVSAEAGIAVTPRHDRRLAYVIAGERDQAATAEGFARLFGIELPLTPKAASRGDLTLVWSGPHQWLVVSGQAEFSRRLADELKDVVAVTDQSDGRAVLSLEGTRVREVLAKGCPVDLHPRHFPRGYAAVTAIAGIGVQLWQAEDCGAYHLVIARSMAGSFWRWLIHSAAEFGVDVRPIT